MADLVDDMVDISNPEFIDIQIREGEDGLRVWVNVDGQCRFRAYRVSNLFADSETKKMMVEKVGNL